MTESTKYPLTPDMQFIADGLAAAAQQKRRELDECNWRFDRYISQCAREIGVDASKYAFDPGQKTFVRLPESSNNGSDNPKPE